MVSELEKSKQQKLTQRGTRVNLKAMNLAASWYIAMPSKDLGKKPKAIELFGQPLVAWRDQTGHPLVLERYCSHMGASLAIGKVVNGCIQCPYHHWHYDGSGQCVSIPEVERIPPMARQVTYVTAERYGYIWVWYGSQTPLFPLPEFPAAEEQRHNYMPLRYTYDTKTTVWRLVESGGVDYYHAVALHKQKIAGSVQLTLLDDQHSARQSEPPIQKEGWFKVLMEFPVEKYLVGPFSQVLGLSAETFSFQTDIWPSGYRITGFADNEETFRVLFGTTPVTENRTVGHYLMMLKKTGKFWLDIPSYMLYAWYNKIISAEDMSVFNTQNADVSRAYVKHDQGVLKYRQFYQRWVDKVE